MCSRTGNFHESGGRRSHADNKSPVEPGPADTPE
jgi:hypothetical protein